MVLSGTVRTSSPACSKCSTTLVYVSDPRSMERSELSAENVCGARLAPPSQPSQKVPRLRWDTVPVNQHFEGRRILHSAEARLRPYCLPAQAIAEGANAQTPPGYPRSPIAS
jgi:hypothetical protein